MNEIIELTLEDLDTVGGGQIMDPWGPPIPPPGFGPGHTFPKL